MRLSRLRRTLIGRLLLTGRAVAQVPGNPRGPTPVIGPLTEERPRGRRRARRRARWRGRRRVGRRRGRGAGAGSSASRSSESSIAVAQLLQRRAGGSGAARRQASIASVSSRGRSGRRRRSGRARAPIARAVAAGVGAAVRVLAAPALVEHQGQRVDVGLGAGLAALGLLGRHVGEGADDVAGRGQRRGVGEAGDAEVHQLRARLRRPRSPARSAA